MDTERQHSLELELNILQELKAKLPHRRFVFEIGDKFEGEDISEQLSQYGEVIPKIDHGKLFEEQLQLFKFSRQELLGPLLAPCNTDLYSEQFSLDKDHYVTITLLEHEKAVGFVELTYYKNLEKMMSKHSTIAGPNWTEENRRNMESLNLALKKLATKVTNSCKIRSIENLLFDRTLIVHPEHRKKGIGAHLKLMQLFAGWFLSMENMEHSRKHRPYREDRSREDSGARHGRPVESSSRKTETRIHENNKTLLVPL